MLGHPDRDRRQLFDLTARRLTDRHALIFREDVPAGQRSGQCSITSSTAQAGNSSRPWPSWPGCAPRERPERSLPAPWGSRAGLSSVAARSCASSCSAHARASPPGPRAGGSGDPSPAEPRPRPPVRRRRSPPPRRAPRIRYSTRPGYVPQTDSEKPRKSWGFSVSEACSQIGPLFQFVLQSESEAHTAQPKGRLLVRTRPHEARA